MTPQGLLDRLAGFPAGAPVSFETADGPAGPGYHVTELKLSRVESIDCGARVSEWAEAALQVLDGEVGTPMTVGKLGGILAQSVRRVDGLGPAPLRVEFAHGNRGLRIWDLAGPELVGERVVLRLSEGGALCKPAAEMAAAGAACCTGGRGAAACCG